MQSVDQERLGIVTRHFLDLGWSRAEAQAYVDGPLLEHLRHDPRVVRVSHRLWDTHALSALTRAPEAAPAAVKEVA